MKLKGKVVPSTSENIAAFIASVKSEELVEEIKVSHAQIEVLGQQANDVAVALDYFGVPRIGYSLGDRVKLLANNGWIKRSIKRVFGHWGWMHVCRAGACPKNAAIPTAEQIRKFLYGDEGQDLAEYAIALSIIALVAIAIALVIAQDVGTLWSRAHAAIDAAGGFSH